MIRLLAVIVHSFLAFASIFRTKTIDEPFRDLRSVRQRMASASPHASEEPRTRAGPNPAELVTENQPGTKAVSEAQEPLLESTEAETIGDFRTE